MSVSLMRFSSVRRALSCFFLLFVVGVLRQTNEIVGFTGPPHTANNRMALRKLLQTDNTRVKEARIGEPCSKDDVAVYQGTTPPLPSGIPTYTVEILNVCMSGCTVAEVHVSCGWFSSASMINPKIFRRVGYDDCLVNDGNALPPGGSLSFQYANTYRYPLYVTSLACY